MNDLVQKLSDKLDRLATQYEDDASIMAFKYGYLMSVLSGLVDNETFWAHQTLFNIDRDGAAAYIKAHLED